MAERSSKSRLSSTVVVPRSNRRERRERSRSPNHFESRKNRRNKDYNQHDDRVDPHSERTSTDDSPNENRPRRNRQNEQPAVRERLGFIRDRERQPKMIEINTDPRDVPRGKRYFEHDDRESGYNNQKFGNNNRRRSFPRQRSRSPVWKHDYFEQEERRNRLQRPRQSSWRQRDRSPAWKHDKFEELENNEKQEAKDDNDKPQERRKSS